MTNKELPVLDKVLSFKPKELIRIIRTAASKKKWAILDLKIEEGLNRLHVCCSDEEPAFCITIIPEEPRRLAGPFKMPRTRLTVYSLKAREDEIDELDKVLHMAFFRGGG